MLIDELITELKLAHSEADWQRIAELNNLTRPSVEAAMQVDNSALLDLRPKLEELAHLYQLMQKNCVAQRDSLAEQITGISAGRQGIEQYSATSSL